MKHSTTTEAIDIEISVSVAWIFPSAFPVLVRCVLHLNHRCLLGKWLVGVMLPLSHLRCFFTGSRAKSSKCLMRFLSLVVLVGIIGFFPYILLVSVFHSSGLIRCNLVVVLGCARLVSCDRKLYTVPWRD